MYYQLEKSDVGYIIELEHIQSELFKQYKDDDLLNYGELLVDVWQSKTIYDAWEDDGGSKYRGWPELFEDTELIKKAIDEVINKQ